MKWSHFARIPIRKSRRCRVRWYHGLWPRGVPPNWTRTQITYFTSKLGMRKDLGLQLLSTKELKVRWLRACSYMRAGLLYETSAFNKQDDPKTSLSNKSGGRIPCSTTTTRCLSRSNLSMRTVNEHRRHKRSVRSTHDQDNLSTVQSQTATLGKLGKFTFKMGFFTFKKVNSSVRKYTF